MKTELMFVLLALMIWANMGYANIEVRFVALTSSSSSSHQVVEIEIRNTSEDVILADQNYRFYYDADKMLLDESSLKNILPTDKYAPIILTEHVRDIYSDHIVEELDGELAFINFSIELLDAKNGGLMVNSSNRWMKVAQLEFEKLVTTDHYPIIWARDGLTDQLATAYVQMTEWNSPYTRSPLDLDYYDHIERVSSMGFAIDPSISVGPNPTSDWVEVNLKKGGGKEVKVIISDMSGTIRASKVIHENDHSKVIDVSVLPAATYIIEIIDEGGTVHFTDKLVVAK